MTSLLSFGYSPFKLLYPTLFSGLLFTLFVVYISERIVPKATKMSYKIRHRMENRALSSYIKNQDWFKKERFSIPTPSTTLKQKFLKLLYCQYE